MSVTHYLVFVSGQPRWLTFVEAYEILDLHILNCFLGAKVHLEDDSERDITPEERRRLEVAAEKYSYTYR